MVDLETLKGKIRQAIGSIKDPTTGQELGDLMAANAADLSWPARFEVTTSATEVKIRDSVTDQTATITIERATACQDLLTQLFPDPENPAADEEDTALIEITPPIEKGERVFIEDVEKWGKVINYIEGGKPCIFIECDDGTTWDATQLDEIYRRQASD